MTFLVLQSEGDIRMKLSCLQYRLKSLLLLVPVVAGICVAIKVLEAKRQRELTECFRDSCGAVLYDWQLDTNGDFVTTQTNRPTEWFGRVLGPEYFHDVVGVTFSSCDTEFDETNALEYSDDIIVDPAVPVPAPAMTFPSDDALQPLQNIRRLLRLDVSGTHISDRGMSILRDCNTLRVLDVSCTMITDASMPAIRQCGQLRALNVSNTDISDDSIPILERMTTLRHLNIRETQITENGYQKLKGQLTECEVIYKEEWNSRHNYFLNIRCR